MPLSVSVSTPPPRPMPAVSMAMPPVGLLLGLGLAGLAPAALAQAPLQSTAPASVEDARILTPSVSNEDPNFGGKAVVTSTPGKAGPVAGPPDTTYTAPLTSATPAAGRAGAVVVPDNGVGGSMPASPPPLPVPVYGARAPAYTRDVVTGGDVLAMPGEGTVTTVETVRLPANVPRKGASMADVRARYGSPQAVYKTGGGSRAQPPITRWTYPSFNVVFEYTHVVDVVVPAAPPPLVRTRGLTAMPVNPASPMYMGTPGRALAPSPRGY